MGQQRGRADREVGPTLYRDDNEAAGEIPGGFLG
jgi:hypothetical protein